MNIFNKAKGLRKQNAIKSQLSSLGLKLPSTSFSTVGTSQNSNNEVSLNERIKQMSLKDLIEQRVESTEYMDLAERTDFLERFCKVDNSSLTERTAKSQKKLFEKFGDNAVRIVDNRLVKVVDALKSHPIIRPSNFSYQTSLDNYKFKDGRDYQVLQRTDELEGLSRLNYLEMQNTHFLNKMKHVLEEGDHFSKFESNYQAEV